MDMDWICMKPVMHNMSRKLKMVVHHSVMYSWNELKAQ